jgi:hypothetical protein
MCAPKSCEFTLIIRGPIQRMTNRFVNSYYEFPFVVSVTELAIVSDINNGPQRSPNLLIKNTIFSNFLKFAVLSFKLKDINHLI